MRSAITVLVPPTSRSAGFAGRILERFDTQLPQGGGAPEQAEVLRNFLVDGRLTSIPAQKTKRRVVLDFLSQQFEPGKAYPERDVNMKLGLYHRDYAALRRYLVDEEFLERRDAFYWRTGGSFDVE